MCFESNAPRTVSGGAIATLHPHHDTGSPLDSLNTCQLHLRNDTSSAHPRTIATLISPTSSSQAQSTSVAQMQRYHVVIQRDGDLTTPTSPSPPMHSFQFPVRTAAAGDESLTLKLDTAMDLSVGGEGLIGRRVQLVEFESGSGGVETPRVVREGVLGWN